MATPAKEAIRLSSAAVFQRFSRVDSTWRKRAPHLFRERERLVHAVHFQASQFGSSDHAKFTVNLVVSSKPVYEAWCGCPFPANPATAMFPIQQRVGLLLKEKRDLWWDATLSSDLDVLASEVAEIVSTAAEGFFSRYFSLESLLEELRLHDCLPGLTKHQGPVVHGIVASLLGSRYEAVVAFKKAIAGSPIEGFRSNVVRAASRVGVTV